MSQNLDALRASAQHLRDVVAQLEEHHHTASAYPDEWTIADTMSHIGSGAVILARRFTDHVSGAATPEGFNQSVWDEWNAKSPASQIADALVADEAFVRDLDATSSDVRETFHISFGPFDLDFDQFVGLRLGEHVLHTWDVEVTLHPGATLAEPAAAVLLDRLHLVAGRSGRATGQVHRVRVRTQRPTRDFTVVYDEASVSLVDDAHDEVDVELPAEAFVRLVYGRLDALAGLDDAQEVHLEHLRQTFPGF